MLLQLLLLLIHVLGDAFALNSYIYYDDAVCSGEEFIKGTLIYTYSDDYNSLLEGFSVDKYDGPCKYFHGGFFDFDYDSTEEDSLTSVGYCMKCNGVVGCSQTKDSCSKFQSYPPMGYARNATVTATDEYSISLAMSTEETLYRQIYNANTYPLKGLRLYSIIGGMVAMAAILILLKKSIKQVHDETMERKAMEEQRQSHLAFDCIDLEELMGDQTVEIDRKKSKLTSEASLLIPSFMFESEKSMR